MTTERLNCYYPECQRARRQGHRFCQDHEAQTMRRRPAWLERGLTQPHGLAKALSGDRL